MTDLLYCPHYTRVGFASIGTKTAVVCRLRCKRWACDFCAKKNASIWIMHLKDKLPEVSNEWYFLTLTAPPFKRSAASSLASIRNAVNALFKRVKRVFGEGIEYVRVYEKHPTSEAIHSHYIVCGLSPYVAVGSSVKHQPMAIGVLSRNSRYGVWSAKTWFKKTAQELKMGQQVDVQKIEGEPEDAIGYLGKYLTKSQQDIPIKGLRHIQATAGIGGPKHETNPNWRTASYITPYQFEPNTQITDVQTGEIIDNNYWEVHTFWPYD